MIDIILQIFAAALPIISFYLVAENNKWGFIVGIACQPFWFYLTISNQSWGLVAATVFYTLIHIKGIYKEFFKKKSPFYYSNSYKGLSRATYKNCLEYSKFKEKEREKK